MKKLTLLLFTIVAISSATSAFADEIKSSGGRERNFITHDGATLPKGKAAVTISFGAPFPAIYSLGFDYGVTDWFDVGLHGSSVGWLTMAGAQFKFRLFESASKRANLGFQLVVDYTHVADDSTSNGFNGAYLWPALVGGVRFGAEKQHAFIYDLGVVGLVGNNINNCDIFCGASTAGVSSDFALRPGAGVEIYAGRRINWFIRGYGLIGLSERWALPGGETGIAIKSF